MSGGSFDYIYSTIESRFIEVLARKIDQYDIEYQRWKEEENYGYYGPEKIAIERMATILKKAIVFNKILYETEWYDSGDTGLNHFMAETDKLLKQLEE